MSFLLGAIADDFTGATDLANTLVKEGMRVVQVIGVPATDFDAGNADAVVVALKSRTIAPKEAIDQSLAALTWLRKQGVTQVFFKYCSTFDSTDQGNIGPVADALLNALSCDLTIFCPAFPTNGRTVFKGHLFVDDMLLSESPMKYHPLTPMHDANLVRLLGQQTPHSVGLVAHEIVAGGSEAIRAEFDTLRAQGIRHTIVDAIDDKDLRTIGESVADLPLITGGSGIALGLPENFRRQNLLSTQAKTLLPSVRGRAAILAGSCSKATRSQLDYVRNKWPLFKIDPSRIADGIDVAAEALTWVKDQAPDSPIVLSSSDNPDAVSKIQAQLGRDKAGSLVENTMAAIATGLANIGFDQLIVAGGETSGAIVSALNIKALRIGPEIDPGVPWCETLQDKSIALALKSGNFGAENFFEKALYMLREGVKS